MSRGAGVREGGACWVCDNSVKGKGEGSSGFGGGQDVDWDSDGGDGERRFIGFVGES